MTTGNARSATSLRRFITERVAAELGMAEDAIEPDVPLAEYGLDSAGIVGLSGELAELLGRPLAPTLAFDFPTIDALAEHLAEAPSH